MITHIILENFRNWEDRVEIPLGRLTMLYGPNSAGKSSVLCALDLLIQSLEEAGDYRIDMCNIGSRIQLGDFINLVYKHDEKREISIGAKLKIDDRNPYAETGSKYDASIIIKFKFSPKTRSSGVCSSINLSINDVNIEFYSEDNGCPIKMTERSNELLFGFAEADQRFAEQKDYDSSVRSVILKLMINDVILKIRSGIPYEMDFLGGDYFIDLNKLPEGFTEDRILDMYREVNKCYTQFAEFFINGVMAELSSLKHIGPLRKYNGRLPTASSMVKTRYDVGHEGEGLLDVLLLDKPMKGFMFQKTCKLKKEKSSEMSSVSIQDDNLSLSKNNEGVESAESEKPILALKNIRRMRFKWFSTVLERTNRILKKVKFGYTLRIREIHDKALGCIRWVLLRQESDGTIVSLSDVGSGISQSLPIIVQVATNRGGFLCIEQPEIHLHPRLQVMIGQVFTDCVAENPNLQIICETHSPEILLRILNRIADKKLDHKDLQICYVHGTQLDGKRSGKFELIRVDKSGAVLDDWPEGFFQEKEAETRRFWGI